MSYQSNLPAIRSRMAEASKAGLIAAVHVPMNKTAQDLASGFTSGAFTQGVSKAAVNRSEPFEVPGGFAILYGTHLLYNLYWTLGHFNLFTRRFERVDKWTPHFYGSRSEQMAAFQRTYQRFMGGGAGGFGQRAASPRSPR
jgi:hypothetical protein